MSTRTIAVDAQVYERLAAVKKEGESFSKTIDRLLRQVGAAHTGDDILHGLADFAALSREESEAFLQIVRENRAGEVWNKSDLR